MSEERKEIKIEVPNGFEIDKENSTFERIVFKKKESDRPKTWEEFCKNYKFSGNEYYIKFHDIYQTITIIDKRSVGSVGYMSSREEAEAFLALMQLRQLREAWVGNWDSIDTDKKFAISSTTDPTKFDMVCYHTRIASLTFPTEEMAIEFIECFGDLLKKARILL